MHARNTHSRKHTLERVCAYCLAFFQLEIAEKKEENLKKEVKQSIVPEGSRLRIRSV